MVQAQPEGFVQRHRFVLLFVALLVFYVVLPILQQVRDKLHPLLPVLAEGVLFIVVLMGAVVSVSQGRRSIGFVALLGLPVLVLWVGEAIVASDSVAVLRHVFAVVFLGYVIGVMLRAIFHSQQVTFNTVCASLCIYLLLGLVWALAYSVVDVLDPTAFTVTVAVGKTPPRLRVGQGDTAVLYFSFATLTTLGYGDIVPTSPISRMLASIEAISGQLYLAVLVARLVGMHIVHSLEQDQKQRSEHEEGPN
jgi:hypothetical protein